MRKIGIITFHHSFNFGATLQAYALSSAIKMENSEARVLVLDYRNPVLASAGKLLQDSDRIDLKALAKVAFRSVKHHGFDRFDKKHLPLSRRLSSYRDLADEVRDYDALVVGSDQVWKDDNTGSDAAFYLDFAESRATRFSYSASFAGSEEVAAQVVRDHREQLDKFDTVSLREPDGIELFRPALSCEVRQDVDPVLLLSDDKWHRIASDRLIADPYVFMYVVNSELNIRHFAEDYATKHGLRLIDNKTSIEFLKHCAPEDFLSWIMHAECVITNSFHGTAFSLIFHKNSYYELKKGKDRNYRSAGLLDAAGIYNREIEGVCAPHVDPVVDWENVESRLESLREQSLSYVRRIANGAIEDDGTFGTVEKVSQAKCAKRISGEGAPRFFVAMHRDDDVYRSSSSGGAFTALTDSLFDAGSSVSIYGCALDADLVPLHIRATSQEGRNRMRGSKYIQSNIRDCYEEVKEDLIRGMDVLFSGSPCQIAAMRKYLTVQKVDASRLVTLDFVCHGVGSPKLFYDFVSFLEKRYGGKAISCNFRSKRTPEQIQDLVIRFDNGREYHVPGIRFDLFYTIYLSNLALRSSCYKCPFARPQRVSDITLADAWGFKRSDGRGSSLVIANTRKGLHLLISAQKYLELTEVDADDYPQPQLNGPVDEPDNRGEFWRVYRDQGFIAAERWFGNLSTKTQVLKTIAEIADHLGLRERLKNMVR